MQIVYCTKISVSLYIRGGNSAATILQLVILRTYHRKMSYRRLFIAQNKCKFIP